MKFEEGANEEHKISKLFLYGKLIVRDYYKNSLKTFWSTFNRKSI
jgi:hypothetical protein